MVLYKDNKKIQDIAEYGIYYGNMPIKEVYKGSQLVYEYNSYIPNTIIIDTVQAASKMSFTHTLPKGVYKISMIGTAGYTHSHFYVAWTYYHGSTGGIVEVEYYSDGITPITFTIDPNATTSASGHTTLSVNENVIVQASGGADARGANGNSNTDIANIISEDSNILNVITNKVGLRGSTNTEKASEWEYNFADGYSGAGASRTNNPNSYVSGAYRIQYLRASK